MAHQDRLYYFDELIGGGNECMRRPAVSPGEDEYFRAKDRERREDKLIKELEDTYRRFLNLSTQNVCRLELMIGENTVKAIIKDAKDIGISDKRINSLMENVRTYWESRQRDNRGIIEDERDVERYKRSLELEAERDKRMERLLEVGALGLFDEYADANDATRRNVTEEEQKEVEEEEQEKEEEGAEERKEKEIERRKAIVSRSKVGKKKEKRE
jgi:hypothetical protein